MQNLRLKVGIKFLRLKEEKLKNASVQLKVAQEWGKA
jgi:hypothetical protein